MENFNVEEKVGEIEKFLNENFYYENDELVIGKYPFAENVEVDEVGSRRESFKNQAILRTGETRLNNTGSLMCVDLYNNSHDIWVKFIDSGYMVHTTWQAFDSGNVKNVYDRSVYGVGYIGEGEYRPKVNGNPTPQYMAWGSMMQRCYSEKSLEKYPTYRGCTVAEEWHCFQNFAKWYDENFYQIEGHKTNLEKDLLTKGNKVYSSETCCFVPQNINMLIVKRESQRGSLPIGVRVVGKKFNAQCNNGSKNSKKHLGYFNTPEEAFEAYKTYKQSLIKDIANQYKDCIPANVYHALMNYEVQIND